MMRFQFSQYLPIEHNIYFAIPQAGSGGQKLAAVANISANDYESRQDVIERNVVFAKKYADVEM